MPLISKASTQMRPQERRDVFRIQSNIYDRAFKFNFIKMESNTGVSCECCKMFKNTYFEENLRAAVSVLTYLKHKIMVSDHDFTVGP